MGSEVDAEEAGIRKYHRWLRETEAGRAEAKASRIRSALYCDFDRGGCCGSSPHGSESCVSCGKTETVRRIYDENGDPVRVA